MDWYQVCLSHPKLWHQEGHYSTMAAKPMTIAPATAPITALGALAPTIAPLELPLAVELEVELADDPEADPVADPDDPLAVPDALAELELELGGAAFAMALTPVQVACALAEVSFWL